MRISDWSSDVCSSDLFCNREYGVSHHSFPQRRHAETATQSEFHLTTFRHFRKPPLLIDSDSSLGLKAHVTLRRCQYRRIVSCRRLLSPYLYPRCLSDDTRLQLGSSHHRPVGRSAERRVGKAGASTCGSRGA